MSLSKWTTRTRGAPAACAAPGSRTAASTTSEAKNARRKALLTAVRILSTCARSLSRPGTLAEDRVVRSLRLVVLLLLLSPAAAKAADATIVSQDLPVGIVRTTAAAA